MNVLKKLPILLISGFLFSFGSFAQDNPALGGFTASTIGGKVYLKWQLLAGATCLGIWIYRSDSSLNFAKIGQIGGVCGSLSEPQSYSFIDAQPLTNTRNFYRLELGQGNFSQVIHIDIIDLAGEAYQVRPNPFRTNSDIYFKNDLNQEYRITLFDQLGKVIERQQTQQDFFAIKAYGYKPGIYFFNIISADNSQQIMGKFLVLP